jgi:hypothetical protein
MEEKSSKKLSQVFKLKTEAFSGLKPGIKIAWKVDEEYFLTNKPNYILLLWCLKDSTSSEFLGGQFEKIEALQTKILLKEPGEYKIIAFLIDFKEGQVDRFKRFIRTGIEDFGDTMDNHINFYLSAFNGTIGRPEKYEKTEAFFCFSEKNFKLQRIVSKLKKGFSHVFFGVLHFLLMVLYAIYLIVAPSVIFFFGYCPKKPKDIWLMFKKALQKEEDYPFEVRHCPEPDKVYPYAEYYRLIWCWGKKTRALPFSPFGLIIILISLMNVGLFIILASEPITSERIEALNFGLFYKEVKHTTLHYLVSAIVGAFFLQAIFSDNKKNFEKLKQEIGFKIMNLISKTFFLLGFGLTTLLLGVIFAELHYLLFASDFDSSFFINIKNIALSCIIFTALYYLVKTFLQKLKNKKERINNYQAKKDSRSLKEEKKLKVLAKKLAENI